MSAVAVRTKAIMMGWSWSNILQGKKTRDSDEEESASLLHEYRKHNKESLVKYNCHLQSGRRDGLEPTVLIKRGSLF